VTSENPILDIPEITLSYDRSGRPQYGRAISGSLDAANIIRALFKEGEIELQEHLFVLYLNTRNTVIGYYHHSKGGIAQTTVDNRLILAGAIKSLSTSIIIAHNHPSGNLKPSESDKISTSALKEAATLLNIKLLDSLIITKDGFYSFSDEGLLGLSGISEIPVEEQSGNTIPKPLPAPASSNMVKKTPSQREALSKTILPKTDDNNDDESDGVHYSEKLPDEIRFIRRYINLDDKVKTKDEILRFINALQKAILEKRIRKSSPYAGDIAKIQRDLVNTYNTMKGKVTFVISSAAVKKYREATAGERVYLSVQYLNKFRNIIGKTGIKKKAAALAKLITAAIENGKIARQDPYYKWVAKALQKLTAFTKHKTAKTLDISRQELNGLAGIPGCDCPSPVNGLDGYAAPYGERPQIMNSLDFVQLEFKTLGFTGKWLDFIGDPSGNFTAMVYGKPKFGKSFLCIDFAGYLARNHGKVLYVAKEETLDKTLQDKLKDKEVAHINLTVSSIMPDNLRPYDFVFIDSINKFGYTPENLNRLRALNPSKSFIFIFQTTKDGNFRGSNSFQHDVDVVIEVPEPGIATQMGRFNQGGTMRIFGGDDFTT
jgi:hypothetical protein